MQQSGSNVHRVGTLEVDEHLPFQELSWRLQWLGRIAVALFVIAGLAGVFGGGGPLVRAHADTEAGRVTYPRFLRAHAPVELRVTPTDRAKQNDSVTLSFSARLFEDFQLEQITPEPRSQHLANGRIVYEFDGTEENLPAIVLRLKATKPGWTTSELTLANQPPVRIRSLVFP